MTFHPQLDQTIHYQIIDSTSSEAHRQRQSVLGQNILYVADEQTKGKGQHGRTWESNAGQGLWASLFISRPELMKYDLSLLSLYTGLTLQTIIKRLANIDTALKWPNDIMVGAKKCGGILTEVQWSGSDPQSAIIGFGINLKQGETDFSPEIRKFSTSLLLEGSEIDRDKLVQDITSRFLSQIGLLQNAKRLLSKWNTHAWKLGEEIQWQQGDEVVTGIFQGVTAEGHARIQVGVNFQTFSSGEIRWMI